MNKRLAKIISMLLCLVMLIGAFTMLPITAKAAGTEVSRSQWLQALTQTFEMSVEEDNYPDNYFSDLSSDSEYYYDMLLAVEFGLVDIPAGGELRPDDPATREFAAQTLNFCLGYQLGENASYTFSEASTVDHPDDIQIAIDRGWFALNGKSFLPNQPITVAEMETMLADAKTVLAKGTDDGSEDTYEFADHVAVIPQGSIAYENEQGQIVLEYNDIPLAVGDTFAVTTEIFPQTYTVDNIVTEGSKTVITVTEVPLTETLLSMHTSGSAVGDLADVEPAEGVDMVYVLEDNTRTRTIDGSKPVKELIFPIEIGGLKVYVELTKLYVDYYVDAHGGDLDAVVTLRGDVYFSCTVPFGVSVGEFSDIMELCSLPVAGIGSLSAYMDISLDGSATAVYSGSFMGGVSYESPFGFRIIHSFQKKSFTINVEAILNASMNVSLAADKIPFITARCTATIGTKCLFDFDYRGEDATPKTCMHTDAWVYAHLYTYASVGYKKISESYSNMLTLFDRNNSPLRSVTHFEDGIMVSHCTIDTDYTRYGRYYTSPSSRYANGGGSSVASSSVESSPVFTYTLNEVSKAVITGYGGKTAALSIPSTIDGYTVVGIGDNALKGKSLTSVVLPATVTYIGENAFQNCSSLREISLPDGLVSIGEDAFSGCSNLRVLYLPDMVTSIETSAFYNCTSLSKVVLPKNLETIGALAFYNCDKLTAIEIPKALKKTTDTIAFGGIVVGPFYDCDGLKTVTFEEGTTAIANGLFANCTGLEEIIIPDTVTTIGSIAFEYCKNLESVQLSSALTKIGSSAFWYCTSLAKVEIPNAVTEIVGSAFYNCTSLSKVVLPKNLETMGALAFYNCDKLTSIEIPKALKRTTDTIAFGGIVDGPFYDCDGLKTVTFEEGTTAIANGLFANCTGLEEIVIPYTVTTIGSVAFEYCKNLETVQLSSALTKIGSSAFWYCTSLAKVEIPNAVTEIAGSAFYNCTSLSKVVLPKNLETMGAYAFYNCDKLKTIEIPKALKRTTDVMASGGWYVYGPFYDCDGLKTATFEDGTTAIAIGLFANCTGLEEIVIPDTVTTIGNKAFQGCSSLNEIVIPNTVTSIGGSVFSNCSSLVIAKWPDSLPTIPSYTFSGCSALTDLTMPDNLSSIESYAFASCSALPELILPTTVKRIGDFCFQNCTALAKIEFPDGITSVGNNSFYNCDALVDITLPDTVTSLGKFCFWGCDLLEAVKLSSALSIIPESCFQQCIALKEVAIPRFVTTIEKNAFNACTKLEKVIIPREVTTIGTTAFSYPDRMTIYGVSGTYAETYANENDFPFVDSPESATSATLNTKQLTLNKGASETLVLTVTPETYTDAVTWKSSDTSIVTVSDRGVVKAIAVGTATIKVNVGSKSASCKVTVVQPVTSINLNKTSLSMDALQTFALTATAKPDNAYNKTIVWSSSDETVATVDENGLVTALKKGSATITAAAQDGSGVTRKCTVTVNNSAHIVNRLSQFESPHNYPDNCTDFWVFTVAGEEKLQVTFDDRTNIEEDFDFLKIFDGSGNLVGEYTGTTLAGQTVEVSGDTVRIQLISDEGGNEWGFKVTDLGVDIPNEAEGTCGAEALWELNLDTGELMIFGSGAMENYTSAEDTPWYEFRDSIRTVVIGDRITAIGDHAFDGCGKLTTVFVPTSVTSIGDHAFANCGALKTVNYVGEKAAWDNIDAGTGNTALSNTVSTEAAEQKPVKEVEIDTSKKDLEITVNRCANTFEQIMVGIYDQNGKMVDALLIAYDGLAETVTTELPQQYKNGYIIKTFCTDTDAAPMYQAQVHG